MTANDNSHPIALDIAHLAGQLAHEIGTDNAAHVMTNIAHGLIRLGEEARLDGKKSGEH